MNKLSRIHSETNQPLQTINSKNTHTTNSSQNKIMGLGNQRIRLPQFMEEQETRLPKPSLKRTMTEPLLLHDKLLTPPCTDKQLVDEYGSRIISTLVKEEEQGKFKRFLEGHKDLTPKLRAQLINWFIEIV